MKHKHHIIPKHMGGTNDPSNLIELTVEEHGNAHKLLWEQHGLKQDWLAWQGLTGLISKQDLLHELFVLAGKKSRPPEGHKANLGKKWTEEHKKKISETTKGVEKTDIHKQNISKGKSKNWIITKPDGTKINIINLEKYCIENNLDGSKMSMVASGIRNHHKGHFCERVGT
tara:strand:+ start:46 stop:558 length:513 start_codon:yes stop_codon:yes gene_type:complete